MTAITIGVLYLTGFIAGAWIALIILSFSSIPEHGLTTFSGGFLTGFVVFMLLPHAFEHYERINFMSGLAISIIIMAIFHRIAHQKFLSGHSFTFIAIAMAFHTIPISFTIGTVLTDPVAARSLTLAAILHHIPEAAALTLWIVSRKGSLVKLFLFYIFLSAIAVFPIFAGKQFGISFSVSSIFIGLSIGILVFTIFTEFIFSKQAHSSRKKAAVYTLTGFAVFSVMMWLLRMIGIN